jgi:hypothetical protein
VRRPTPVRGIDQIPVHVRVGSISGEPGLDSASVDIDGVVYTSVTLLATGHALRPGNRVLVATYGNGELAVLAKAGRANDGLPDIPSPSSPGGDFPPGVTYWPTSTGAGWPAAGRLIVLNFGSRAVQVVLGASTGLTSQPAMTVRSWNGTVWTPWALMGGAAPAAAQTFNGSAQSSIPTAAYTAGSPVVGLAYTVPPSGRVRVSCQAYAECWSDQNLIAVTFEVRDGGTIGSGTVLHAAHANYAIIAGMAVNPSAPSIGTGLRWLDFTGLTPGGQINARVMHIRTGAASADRVVYRQLNIDPL